MTQAGETRKKHADSDSQAAQPPQFDKNIL